MGRGKIEMKKIENAVSRHVTFCKRCAGLFKKARELAILCDAEVAIILFSSDGKISEFASSDMQRILTRFRNCLESRNLRALKFKPEHEPEEQVTEEVGVLRQEAQKLKLKERNILGKDLTHMDLHELRALEEQLNEGLLCIKDKQVQIMEEQLEQYRMQKQQVLKENQTLQRRQVEELQGFLPSTSYAVPLSVYFPEKECNVGPAEKEFFPSTSYAAPLDIDNGPETEHKFGPVEKEFFPCTSLAAPLAIDNGPETERNVRPAEINFFQFFPSASLATPIAIDNCPETEHNVVPADKDLDTTLALGPTWGWPKNEDAKSETDSSNPHTQVGRR